QRCARLGVWPFSRASSARKSMNAVVDGLVVLSGRTSGTVILTYASNANAAAGMATAALRRNASALPGKGALQCSAQQNDQSRRRAGAHQADAPDLAGQRSQARADLDVEFVEQMFPHTGFVDAVGNAHGVERPEALALARQDRQAHPFQHVDERF